ncbi:MAG: hypothetical protein Q7K57_07515 [Burkholderiaceae bacterium]|nr:hypothetical protein [Burkholderiaceae bacterium]
MKRVGEWQGLRRAGDQRRHLAGLGLLLPVKLTAAVTVFILYLEGLEAGQGVSAFGGMRL